MTKLGARHAADCTYITKRLLTGDLDTCDCGSEDGYDWWRSKVKELAAKLDEMETRAELAEFSADNPGGGP